MRHAKSLAVRAGVVFTPALFIWGRGCERARSAVSKRIKAAINKIHSHHPPLGRYLRATTKTGHVCSYLPDDAESPTWRR